MRYLYCMLVSILSCNHGIHLFSLPKYAFEKVISLVEEMLTSGLIISLDLNSLDRPNTQKN